MTNFSSWIKKGEIIDYSKVPLFLVKGSQMEYYMQDD